MPATRPLLVYCHMPWGRVGHFAAVIGEPEVVGGEGVHRKGGVREIRVGVHHGVEVPRFELGGGFGHAGGEGFGSQYPQPGAFHVDGEGVLERFCPPAQRAGRPALGRLPGRDGTGVVVAAHRDAPAGARRIVFFEHGVEVGLAVLAAQHPEHHAVDLAAALHRVPVYAALPAGDIQHRQRGVLRSFWVMDRTSFLRLDRLYSGAAECGSVVFLLRFFTFRHFAKVTFSGRKRGRKQHLLEVIRAVF